MEKPQTRRERTTVKRVIRRTVPNTSDREQVLEKDLAMVRSILRGTSKRLTEAETELRELTKGNNKHQNIELYVDMEATSRELGGYIVRDRTSGRTLDGVMFAEMETETMEHREMLSGQSVVDQVVVTGSILTLKVRLR